MSRFVLGAMLLITVLTVFSAALYMWLKERERTRRQKMELRHERDVKEQEMLFGEDDEIERELEKNDR